MARPVRAELLPPRYRLAVIEEPSGRIVARLPEIPAGAVSRIATEIAKILPALRAAAAVKDAVRSILDHTIPPTRSARPPRRGGRA